MPRTSRSGGFEEDRQSRYRSGSLKELPRKPPTYESLKLGEGGRVVIPAAMRAEMGVKPGDTLIATVKDGELTLISRRTALRKVQDKMARYKKPGESVVDEFLTERRAMWGEE